MDSQIYCLNFNNGESIFYAHQHYLEKFEYFEPIFNGEFELNNPFEIEIILNFQYTKEFSKKIIQLALNVVYDCNIKSILNTKECYEFIMLMDYLQYKHMNSIEELVAKIYDGKENFDIVINNFFDNYSIRRVKRKLLDICLVDKFKTQLFHFGYLPVRIKISRNVENRYIIENIILNHTFSVSNEYEDREFTVDELKKWFLFLFGDFLKIFEIKVEKFEFDIYIDNENNLNVTPMIINEHSHKNRFSYKKVANAVEFYTTFDLNTIVRHIIFSKYLD